MSGAATLPQSRYGFHPGPGTDFSHGQERDIAFRLGVLAQLKRIQIYGISGYRTPAHSVAVGGFANDPHTQGKAADIGVGGLTRASAATLSAADLASVGLYRPFGGAQEINHVQVKPGAGPIKFGALQQSSQSGLLSDILHSALPQKTDPSDPHTIGGIQPVPEAAQQGIDQGVQAAVKAAFGGLWDSVKRSAPTWLLTGLFVIAGAAMLVYGLIRAAGGQDTARRAARLIPGVGALA
jgi:hypothetical protein